MLIFVIYFIDHEYHSYIVCSVLKIAVPRKTQPSKVKVYIQTFQKHEKRRIIVERNLKKLIGY